MDTLFELPEPNVLPPKRKPGVPSFKDLRSRRVLAGLHPLNGLPLYVDPAGVKRTCGDCGRHYARRYAKLYHKCSLRAETRGPATDILVSWPACAEFVPKEAQP